MVAEQPRGLSSDLTKYVPRRSVRLLVPAFWCLQIVLGVELLEPDGTGLLK